MVVTQQFWVTIDNYRKNSIVNSDPELFGFPHFSIK